MIIFIRILLTYSIVLQVSRPLAFINTDSEAVYQGPVMCCISSSVT